jgi:hypothetical protein
MRAEYQSPDHRRRMDGERGAWAMARKTVRTAAKKRVPWWVTMDMTPVYAALVVAVMLGLTIMLGRAPRKGSIHACIDAYAAARTQADTERVDAQRPFDTPKLRGVSCGSLRGTPEYVRIQREQTEHATRRGHA